MSAAPKVFVPTAPLIDAADHGICERCEEATGTQMYDDRLLCENCYDAATVGEPHEDYRAEFEQWLDEIEDPERDDERFD